MSICVVTFQLAKPVVVAAHFAAVLERLTVSTAIAQSYTVVRFFCLFVFVDEPLESRGSA